MGFVVSADRAHRLVRVQINGPMSFDDIENYQRAEVAAVHQLGDISEGYDLLVDLSEYPIQSQSVVDAFHAIIIGKRLRANRLAIIASSTLLRMQLRRMIGRDDITFFANASEAEGAGWPPPA